jgi:hypothetical protein
MMTALKFQMPKISTPEVSRKDQCLLLAERVNKQYKFAFELWGLLKKIDQTNQIESLLSLIRWRIEQRAPPDDCIV